MRLDIIVIDLEFSGTAATATKSRGKHGRQATSYTPWRTATCLLLNGRQTYPSRLLFGERVCGEQI